MDFPEQLWKPFEYLSLDLGMSLSGTVYNLYYCNVVRDADGEFDRFRFSFIDNSRMPAIHVTEVNKQTMLVEMAAAGKKLFENMIGCMRCVEGGHEREAIVFLRAVRELSCTIYKLFTHWMQDEYIAYEYWMRYVQGPGGWGIDGEDGLTGAHTLAIPAMDAFLGIQGTSSTWAFTLKHRSHMTATMRSFLEKLEAFDLIGYMKKNEGHWTQNDAFRAEYELCVRRLRGFLIAHNRCHLRSDQNCGEDHKHGSSPCPTDVPWLEEMSCRQRPQVIQCEVRDGVGFLPQQHKLSLGQSEKPHCLVLLVPKGGH